MLSSFDSKSLFINKFGYNNWFINCPCCQLHNLSCINIKNFGALVTETIFCDMCNLLIYSSFINSKFSYYHTCLDMHYATRDDVEDYSFRKRYITRFLNSLLHKENGS